jgi:TonB family protein
MMMELNRTFLASLLLHITFATALFLSAGFLGGSGKMLDEKVFYIDLTAGINMRGSDDSSVRTEAPVLQKPAVEEAIKEPLPVKEKITVEEKLILTDNETGDGEEAISAETVETVKTVAYEGDKHDAPQSSEAEVTVNASYAPASNAGLGVLEDRAGGIIPPATMLLISSAIDKAKTYPLLARRRGMEGTVYVGFRISSSGEPQDIEVVKSSGYNILDKATLKVVRKAAPYPHIEKRIEVPITYRLKDI